MNPSPAFSLHAFDHWISIPRWPQNESGCNVGHQWCSPHDSGDQQAGLGESAVWCLILSPTMSPILTMTAIRCSVHTCVFCWKFWGADFAGEGYSGPIIQEISSFSGILLVERLASQCKSEQRTLRQFDGIENSVLTTELKYRSLLGVRLCSRLRFSSSSLLASVVGVASSVQEPIWRSFLVLSLSETSTWFF